MEKPFQEIYAEEECEKLRKNRKRKLKVVKASLDNADIDEILNHVADQLDNTYLEFDEVIGEQVKLLKLLSRNIANALATG
ncbi:MAG: hypothetical protein ACTSUE_25665 [Promethearchaeota archaeon]